MSFTFQYRFDDKISIYAYFVHTLLVLSSRIRRRSSAESNSPSICSATSSQAVRNASTCAAYSRRRCSEFVNCVSCDSLPNRSLICTANFNCSCGGSCATNFSTFSKVIVFAIKIHPNLQIYHRYAHKRIHRPRVRQPASEGASENLRAERHIAIGSHGERSVQRQSFDL
mgnify:CR=1 FL=1